MVKIISLRLNDETYEKLKEFCKARNITTSDLIRSTINSILSGSQTIQIVINPMQQTKNNIDLSEVYVFKLEKMIERFNSLLRVMDLEINPESLKPYPSTISQLALGFVINSIKIELSQEEKNDLINFMKNVLSDLLEDVEKILAPELLALNDALNSRNYNEITKILLRIESGELSKEIFEKSLGLIDKYTSILKEKLKDKVSESEIKDFLSKVVLIYIKNYAKISLKSKVMTYRTFFKRELEKFIKEAEEIYKKVPIEYHETIKSLLKLSITLLEKIKKTEIEERDTVIYI